MDGSQKLPQRLLNTVRDRLAAGASIDHLTLAVAGWIRYASGVDEQGRAIAVSDPLAPTFAQIAAARAGDPAALAAGFLDLVPVFGTDLVGHAAFRAAVTRHVVALFRDGVRATLKAHLGPG
jgi:fructuronate reductase